MKSDALLKKFVALAPKGQFTVVEDDLYSGFEPKWCIVAKTGEYDPDPNPYVRSMRFDISDDRASAEAILFLWDWLEAMGEGSYISWNRTKKHRFELGFWYVHKREQEGSAFIGSFGGSTRIEALVRACVALWQGEENGR